jgi:hypothetical protein
MRLLWKMQRTLVFSVRIHYELLMTSAAKSSKTVITIINMRGKAIKSAPGKSAKAKIGRVQCRKGLMKVSCRNL